MKTKIKIGIRLHIIQPSKTGLIAKKLQQIIFKTQDQEWQKKIVWHIIVQQYNTCSQDCSILNISDDCFNIQFIHTYQANACLDGDTSLLRLLGVFNDFFQRTGRCFYVVQSYI